MAKQSLKAELGGRELQQRIAETLIKHYYGDFCPFRTLVYEKFPEIVGPPTAMLVTTEGKVKRFVLSWHSFGMGCPITVENMPIVEVALIARAKDADQARRFFGDLHRALAEGAFAAAGKPVPEDLKPLREEPRVWTTLYHIMWDLTTARHEPHVAAELACPILRPAMSRCVGRTPRPPGRILLAVSAVYWLANPGPGSRIDRVCPSTSCSAAIHGDPDCRGAEGR